jgi:hypothetical protein
MQEARALVQGRYLDGHDALFPDVARAWDEQVRSTQIIADMAMRLADLSGVPQADPPDLEALSLRTAELVADLVEPAKADALEKLGEGRQALDIASAWVRTKLMPTAVGRDENILAEWQRVRGEYRLLRHEDGRPNRACEPDTTHSSCGATGQASAGLQHEGECRRPKSVARPRAASSGHRPASRHHRRLPAGVTLPSRNASKDGLDETADRVGTSSASFRRHGCGHNRHPGRGRVHGRRAIPFSCQHQPGDGNPLTGADGLCSACLAPGGAVAVDPLDESCGPRSDGRPDTGADR